MRSWPRTARISTQSRRPSQSRGMSRRSRRSVRDGAWDLTVRAAAPMTLTLNLLYYPRWQATLDGKPAALHPQTATGLTQMALPAGEHVVALRYGRTAAETDRIGRQRLDGRRIGIPGDTCAVDATPVLRRSDRAGARRFRAGVSVWLLGGLAALLVFKFPFVDPSTTLLRCASTPERTCGAATTVDAPFAGGHRLRGFTVSSQTVQPWRQPAR